MELPEPRDPDARLRVLLIEDSPSDAELLEIALRNELRTPFVLTHVDTLAEGLGALQASRFDVLLLDLSLPDNVGLEGASRVLEEFPNLPIVILTGARDESLGPRAIDLGVQDYLVKGKAGPRAISRVLTYAILRQRAEEAIRRSNADLERRVRERTAQLRTLASELTLAEQRERRRLADLLHDDLQQLLVSAKLSVAALRAGRREKSLRDALTAIEERIADAIASSRSLTAELSPPALYAGGLDRALGALAQRLGKRHGLSVDFRAEAGADVRDQGTRVLLYQSVRELLLNVVKHAGVDRAEVRLERAPDGGLRVTVADEGRGFDARQLEADAAAETFGLFSVRERLDQVGGGTEVVSEPGRGTRVTLTVPADAGPSTRRPTE